MTCKSVHVTLQVARIVRLSFVYRASISTTDEYVQAMCLLSTLHLPPLLPCVFNREGKGGGGGTCGTANSFPHSE